jgi:hypothetical protein
MVDRFKQQQPNVASTVQIQAVSLEGVIQTLQTSNNEQLNNIVIVPSQESLDIFAKSLLLLLLPRKLRPNVDSDQGINKL